MLCLEMAGCILGFFVFFVWFLCCVDEPGTKKKTGTPPSQLASTRMPGWQLFLAGLPLSMLVHNPHATNKALKKFTTVRASSILARVFKRSFATKFGSQQTQQHPIQQPAANCWSQLSLRAAHLA